jgi:hypothetical protein
LIHFFGEAKEDLLSSEFAQEMQKHFTRTKQNMVQHQYKRKSRHTLHTKHQNPPKRKLTSKEKSVQLELIIQLHSNSPA